jgi:hypothetical protein
MKLFTKTLLSAVAAIALIAAAAQPSKADVIVIDLGVVGQAGVVGAQLNGSLSIANATNGAADAASTSAAIVNNFTSETDITVDAAVAGCGCDAIVGVGTILGQVGAVGLQANLAGAGAFGTTSAKAAANAVALVNSASKTATISVTTSN